MANIKINELQPTTSELVELSQLELDNVMGGRFFRRVIRAVKKGVGKILERGISITIKF
uniref:Uncharacterized protein n=1 Tax=Nostoc sp. PCC 9205 TaxID=2099383 RepID=A0A2P0ZGM1_9NOSO|nr:hypothetical protein [Nostoc sp. PCC 9205]